VKSALTQGSVIHDVFGFGSRSACSVVSQPLGSIILRALPLFGTGMRIAGSFRIYFTGSEVSFAFPSRLL
jgi:hypothetical protein